MNRNCTVYKTVDFIGKRWTLLILLEIYKGKSNARRYSEIKNTLPGITPKILSARLKELEKKRLVKKKIDMNTYPIASEYSLTEKGLDFISIIKEIKKWSLHWNIKNPECESKDCSKCEF